MFLTFGSYPAFIERGTAAGSGTSTATYIDYMCSFGTNLLGLRHPRSTPPPGRGGTRPTASRCPAISGSPGEELVETLDDSDWCVFAKNGSDVTSYVITVARVATGRQDILLAHGAYQLPFLVPAAREGVPEAWKSHVHYFEYNDAGT